MTDRTLDGSGELQTQTRLGHAVVMLVSCDLDAGRRPSWLKIDELFTRQGIAAGMVLARDAVSHLFGQPVDARAVTRWLAQRRLARPEMEALPVHVAEALLRVLGGELWLSGVVDFGALAESDLAFLVLWQELFRSYMTSVEGDPVVLVQRAEATAPDDDVVSRVAEAVYALISAASTGSDLAHVDQPLRGMLRQAFTEAE
jgi:hypothetical protein